MAEPTGNAMGLLIRQQALHPLDKSRLPKLRNIDPDYLNTAFDHGNSYSESERPLQRARKPAQDVVAHLD